MKGGSILYPILTAVVVSLIASSTVRAQIFVTEDNAIGEYDAITGAALNPPVITADDPWAITESAGQLFVADFGTATISSYSTSGTLINPALTQHSNLPLDGVAASGTDLFTVTYNNEILGNGTIGEYTSAGVTVDAPLVSGLTDPEGIAASGGFLYVTDYTDGTVSKYTTSGVLVNPTLISGLHEPIGIAVSGETVFVTNVTGTIGAYTLTGATVNATLISGLNTPWGLTVSGNDLFVTNVGDGRAGDGSIGEYTISGATANASLITGLDFPKGIVVVPEPSTIVLAVLGMVVLRACKR
jgi:hypothetical protein